MSNTSVPTKAFTFASSGTIRSSEVNENFDRIYTELGNIGTANIIASGVGTEEIASAAVTLDKLATAVTLKLMPAGVVLPYAGTSIPTGWLDCNGAAVSRTTYADLFAAISTTYGTGDGSTTFNLPDITGRVIAGKEAVATRLTVAGAGFSGATLGAAGGAQTHALIISELAQHSHTVNEADHTHTTDPHAHTITQTPHTHGEDTTQSGGTAAGGSAFNAASNVASAGSTSGGSANITINDTTVAVDPASTGITVGNTGSGTAHQNTQPTIVLSYMIKT